MRVISGSAGGRRLKTLGGSQTRPTSDKVKGAIFNVLRGKLQQAKVLDLFGGSGALAIEAISRGAGSALIVEKSSQACTIIQDNISATGFSTNIRLIKRDGIQALKTLAEETFDLIFLDPPYRQGLAQKCLEIIAVGNYLYPNGVIIVETSREEQIPVEIGKISMCKRTRYGDTVVWYYQITETRGREI